MDKKDYDDTIKALTKMTKKVTASKETARAYLESIGLLNDEVQPEELYEPNFVEEFPYVVAQLWHKDKPATWNNLRIYTYGKDVLFGSQKDAESFVEYVKRQKRYDGTSYDDDPEENPWKIYRISFWSEE